MTYYDPFGAYGMILVIIIGIVLVSCVVQIAIAVWVYKDARKRNMEPTMWLAITLLAGCIGCIIYLVVREPIPMEGPPMTKEMPPEPYKSQIDENITEKGLFCPNCGSKIPEGAKFCPSCGSSR